MGKETDALNSCKADDWEEAFDLCREAGHPLVVYILTEDETHKVYPSGHTKKIRDGL